MRTRMAMPLVQIMVINGAGLTAHRLIFQPRARPQSPRGRSIILYIIFQALASGSPPPHPLFLLPLSAGELVVSWSVWIRAVLV
jgi:hypothetical protein